jgi:hypothetical protein
VEIQPGKISQIRARIQRYCSQFRVLQVAFQFSLPFTAQIICHTSSFDPRVESPGIIPENIYFYDIVF